MMYPFLTLNDGTKIVHSEMLENQNVKVYMKSLMKKTVFTARFVGFRRISGRIFADFSRRN